MEKLIKLLNEYYEWWDWKILHWKGIWCEDHDTIWYKDKELTCEQDEIVAYLISKKFWFIKRLLDEWKVRLEHRPRSEDIMDLDRSDYEKLLMMLAVDPDPVKYLISMIE